MMRLAVLISGRGSNLDAIVQAVRNGKIRASVAGVLSNNPQAAGLDKAARAGLATAVVDHHDFDDRASFDKAIEAQLQRWQADVVVLAGFMRVLGAELTQRYHGRMFNIHPSLLPKYPGLHTHRRALEAGDREHGATVHFVTAELDGGPIVAQSRVPILPGDSELELQQRVQGVEHQLYPQVLSWYADHRLRLTDQGVMLDNNVLPKSGVALDFYAPSPDGRG
jgi:phosphoribosylglycinamide formyltransferase-1